MAYEGFLQRATIEAAFVPIDMAGQANTGDWISLENYRRAAVVLFGAVGVAGDDPIFKLQQATASDGTGFKDLLFTVIYEKVGATLAATAAWTRVTQTAATSYVNALSAEAQKLIVVDIDAAMLDVTNGFTFIQLSAADVGAGGAQIGCGFFILYEPRYPGGAAVSALS